jgi:hypothetical protein
MPDLRRLDEDPPVQMSDDPCESAVTSLERLAHPFVEVKTSWKLHANRMDLIHEHLAPVNLAPGTT